MLFWRSSVSSRSQARLKILRLFSPPRCRNGHRFYELPGSNRCEARSRGCRFAGIEACYSAYISAGKSPLSRYGMRRKVMAETRKLAAILAADVVGYSRLTGADEDRTLARLRALRSDLIDPTIAVHHGRVVQRTGDGALVEFRSVVDAVRCAIEVQSGMVERNAGLPAERRIEFRIGIHLGDVVEEGDGDLMGSGINIAARLEGIAKPGAICLSEDAYRQVKGRLDLPVSDLGEIALKNIAEPIRVYALEISGTERAKAAASEGAATRL